MSMVLFDGHSVVKLIALIELEPQDCCCGIILIFFFVLVSYFIIFYYFILGYIIVAVGVVVYMQSWYELFHHHQTQLMPSIAASWYTPYYHVLPCGKTDDQCTKPRFLGKSFHQSEMFICRCDDGKQLRYHASKGFTTRGSILRSMLTHKS